MEETEYYEETESEELEDEENFSEEFDVDVKILWSKGQVSVVEWDDSGRFRRTIVPRNTVLEDEKKNAYISSVDLDKGIPYGADWESRLKNSYIITGARVAEQLEVAGVWTKENYVNNPHVVQQAVLGAAKEILAELSAIAHKIPN